MARPRSNPPLRPQRGTRAIRFLQELRGEMERQGIGSPVRGPICQRLPARDRNRCGGYPSLYRTIFSCGAGPKGIAAEIALRLLEDGSAQAALESRWCGQGGADRGGTDMERDAQDDAGMPPISDCLTALGRVEEAQAHRWAWFTATLNPTPLRDHLKLLPDFDDVEAEDRARRVLWSIRYSRSPAVLPRLARSAHRSATDLHSR